MMRVTSLKGIVKKIIFIPVVTFYPVGQGTSIHKQAAQLHIPKSPLCTMSDPHVAHRRKKVYVTRQIPTSVLQLLQSGCEVTQWDSVEPVPKEELLRNVPGIDALFCLLTDKIDSEVLDAAGSSLKVIGTMSVGYDHLDLQEIKKRNISVGYTPDVLTDATAELTVSLLLSVSRRIVEGVEAVRSGEWSSWKPLWMCGPGLMNSTVGIVGLGRIGLGVAQRIKPFGPKTILYSGNTKKPAADDIGAEYASFEDLVKESDFVIATCPLTAKTQGLFNKEVFAMMKESAIFVNTSRGGIVNQDDLYEALKDGTIRGAGLDVTVPEPLPTDHPLLTLKNCVVLPHIGSATVDTRTLMAEMTARNIMAALTGEEMVSELH